MKDEVLISRLKSGDDSAFEEVVNEYKKKLLGLCYSYTKDYQEAEDISQEVFIALYNSVKNFRGESSLSTFLYRIAVNRCIDFTRKRSIKSFLTGLISLHPSDTEDVIEKSFIRDCILKLPEDMRVPVVLYYHNGLNQREIAEVLNVSQKTIEGRIYRAKQKLEVELKKGGIGECSRNETM